MPSKAKKARVSEADVPPRRSLSPGFLKAVGLDDTFSDDTQYTDLVDDVAHGISSEDLGEPEDGEAGEKELEEDLDVLEEALVPKKRARGGKKAAVQNEVEVVKKDVMYSITILSAVELKKRLKDRTPIKENLYLSVTEPWDTFKAQLLVVISESLNPPIIKFEDYMVTAQIPRHLPNPGLVIRSEKDYDNVVKRAMKIRGDDSPIVNLSIHGTAAGGEGDSNKENGEPGAAKEGKKKSDPALLPGNIQKTQNIQALCERWKCTQRTATCGGTYCFFGNDVEGHLALGHERLDCWASAMMRPDNSCTIDAPPNHRLFPRTNDPTFVGSPVQQRRLDARNRASSTSTPAAPTFNFTLGNDFVNVVNALRAPAPGPPASGPPASSDDSASARILDSSRTPGADMSIQEFCNTYDLDPSILDKLVSNAFRSARHLRFTTIGHLSDMKFAHGEIAALRDAVDTWSRAV
ncbi:hypothetical protein ONZ45_g18620 [Pleurotus djamor]|nr:hypothetical protein ONZ45_g18620 [Pleurotus djamor]